MVQDADRRAEARDAEGGPAPRDGSHAVRLTWRAVRSGRADQVPELLVRRRWVYWLTVVARTLRWVSRWVLHPAIVVVGVVLAFAAYRQWFAEGPQVRLATPGHLGSEVQIERLDAAGQPVQVPGDAFTEDDLAHATERFRTRATADAWYLVTNLGRARTEIAGAVMLDESGDPVDAWACNTFPVVLEPGQAEPIVFRTWSEYAPGLEPPPVARFVGPDLRLLASTGQEFRVPRTILNQDNANRLADVYRASLDEAFEQCQNAEPGATP